MKLRHSDSVLLIWKLAEIEARRLQASSIEAPHLFLGLCKAVDLDLVKIVPKDSPARDEILEELLREMRKLKTIFRTVALDARSFRRALRRRCSVGRDAESASPESAARRLRRSKAAKEAFAMAERLAGFGGSVVYPIHLLFGVASTKDAARDDLLDQHGVEPQRLISLANEAASASSKGRTPPGRN